MTRLIKVISVFSSVINNPKRNYNVFKYVHNRRKTIFEHTKQMYWKSSPNVIPNRHDNSRL